MNTYPAIHSKTAGMYTTYRAGSKLSFAYEPPHCIFKLLVLVHEEGGNVLVWTLGSFQVIQEGRVEDITYHTFLNGVRISGPFSHGVEFNYLFFRLDDPVCKVPFSGSV